MCKERTRWVIWADLRLHSYRAFSSRDHNSYTRNELAIILVYNLYSMPLAVYAIAIKIPQVSIYMTVSTYVAVVFCPIQHLLEVL